MPKIITIWRVQENPQACGQIVLPDRSISIGQKLVENAKNKKYIQFERLSHKIETSTMIFNHCEL